VGVEAIRTCTAALAEIQTQSAAQLGGIQFVCGGRGSAQRGWQCCSGGGGGWDGDKDVDEPVARAFVVCSMAAAARAAAVILARLVRLWL